MEAKKAEIAAKKAARKAAEEAEYDEVGPALAIWACGILGDDRCRCRSHTCCP